MAKCRLYIDESGTHDYTNSEEVNRRYLAITGVMLAEEEAAQNLSPKLRQLKYLVTRDYDHIITLHRREIANRTGVYSPLRNPDIEREWNRQVLNIVSRVDYTICTVVIDKKAHKQRYIAPMNPYHYCVYILVEKYVRLLEKHNHRGDVLAETRGKLEDAQLEASFRSVYASGTSYVSQERFRAALTSRELKFKPKMAIAGLELTELIVMASKLDILHSTGQISSINSRFTRQLISRIQSKYYRNPSNGRIVGYGKKFLA